MIIVIIITNLENQEFHKSTRHPKKDKQCKFHVKMDKLLIKNTVKLFYVSKSINKQIMSLTSGWYFLNFILVSSKWISSFVLGSETNRRFWIKGVLSVQVPVASLVVSLFVSSANNVKGCGVLHTQPPIAKEPHCQRDPLNRDGLFWSSCSRGGCVGEPIGGRALLSPPLLVRRNQVDSLDEQMTAEERKTQIGNPYLIPLFATPPPPSLIPLLIPSFFTLELLSWKRGDRHGQSVDLRHW